MRRTRVLILAAAGAALARPAAAGFDLSGAVGGGYQRTDEWVLSDHSAVTLWDWNANLSLSGSPIRPELMQLSLGGAYAGRSNLYGETTARSDNLTFLGSLSLLSHAVSPLAATLGASLSNVDFHTSGGPTGPTTGSTQTLSYSGTLGFEADRLPAVQVFTSRSESANRSFGAPETEASTTYLSASARQNLSNHSYGLFYETSWNGGTYDDTNYRTHRVRLDLASDVSKDVRFQLTENYYLRLPTLDAPTNPRYDDNALQVGASWTATPRQSHRFNYRYGRQVADFTASPDREVSAQGLSYATDYVMKPGLTLGVTANLDYALERLDAAERSSAGQTLSGTLDWRYPLPRSPGDAIRVGLGVGGGALEPSGRSAEFAYSLRGSLGWETAGPTFAGSVSYQGNYQGNGSARPGWATSHQLFGDARLALGSYASLSGQATLWLMSSESDLFGDSQSRQASLSVIYALRGYQVNLIGGASYGAGSSMPSSAGSLLPREFSSTSRYLVLRVTLPLLHNLRAIADGRVAATSGPGRPTLGERGASLRLGYSLGLWDLSIEERYSTGGDGAFDRSGNVLMIRLRRSFGFRF
jgi:hypothetical protein